MILARILGNIVSTIKHPAYNSTKLMVVQPLKPNGENEGSSLVAVDTIGAGSGETVLILRQGVAAAQVLGVELPPIRSIIVGIVDNVNMENTN